MGLTWHGDPRPRLSYPEGTPNTGLHRVTTAMYLPVPPITNAYPLAGIVANSLSPLLLTYYPPLKGIILGFSHARFAGAPSNDRPSSTSAGFARIIDCYAQPHAWVTAEAAVFRPARGAWLEGVVRFQTEAHVGLVVWNVFHAIVERRRMPAEWQWVALEKSAGSDQGDDEGDIVADQWVVATGSDNKGKRGGRRKNDTVGAYFDRAGKIEGTMAFRARDFDFDFERPGNLSLMTIEGSFLTEEEDRGVDERLGRRAADVGSEAVSA
jgi:DNA-directed RNA polymerase I subunit RPA43